MAEKIKMLKRAHLGHLGRAIKSLEEALVNKDGVNPTTVTKYLESVNIKFQKVQEDSNNLLEEFTEQGEIDKEVELQDELQDKVIDVKTRAEATLDMIKELKEDEKRKKSEAEKDLPRDDRQRTPKLPDLQIQKFNGDLEHYQEFMDAFTSTIDKNKKLDEVDKFRYLRMYLEDVREGDGPKSLIEGFSTTADNYQSALQLIKETYGKKERIIMSHVSKLLNLEVKENLDKGSLRILFNKVQTHVRSLEVLGISSDQFSIFLVPIVLSKLSHHLRVEWGKYKQREDIKELLEYLSTQVQSLEGARQVEAAFAQEKEVVTKKKFNYSQHSSYKADLNIPKQATASALNTVTRKMCIFCPESSDHWVDECSKAKSLPLAEVKEVIIRENACWGCLRRGHRKADCRNLRNVSCEKCKKRHHSLLHEVKADAVCASCTNEVLMPIARGRLVGPTGKQLEVNILLDPASDKSFVDKATSEALELQGHTVDLSLGGITGVIEETKPRKMVKAIVKNRHHLEKYSEVQMIELPVICNTMNRPAVKKEVLDSKYIKELQLADDYSKHNSCKINVLIGLNSYYSVVSGKVRRSPEKPIAVESIFGWLLVSDSSNSNSVASNVVCMFITAEEENQISKQLKKFWELEEINPGKCKWSPKETKVFSEFKNSISYDNKKYTVRLPMIEEATVDEETKNQTENYTNKSVALNRLMKKQNRFHRDPEFKEKYTKAVSEYINSGYAEKVKEEVEPEGCHYMPHQVVLKEDSSSTKVRLVFDGSAAEVGKRSINERLEKGPTLQPPLNAICLRFRIHRIALTSDIKKMYLMVGISEEDRNKVRFLWLDPETNQVEIYRNCVLPFGLRSSPFLAVGTVQHHLAKYEAEYPSLVRKLIESTYMDDFLSGVETEEEAIQLFEDSSSIMKEAGMELMKWTSSSDKVNKVFEKYGVAAEAKKTITDDLENTHKLLGIQYDGESDSFKFKVEEIIDKAQKKSSATTKRTILSIAPMLYDPMGWLNPSVMIVKILMQSIWERGIEWDEAVPPDIEKKWKQWIADLSGLQVLEIPRRYNQSVNKVDEKLSELHVFGDASEAAYAAVAYLKTYDTEGKSEVALMYCKSKVAPIKKVTLPRLELLAAVLAAKVSKFIKEEVLRPDIKTYLWTDAKIVLQWIKSSSRLYKTFIANRVELAHELSDPADWRWCPGASNPADLPSRGVRLPELVKRDTWFIGPDWLRESPESYPQSVEIEKSSEELLELKPTVCLVQQSVAKEKPLECRLAGKLVNPMKYSKWKKVLNTTAYVARYLSNIRNKEEDRKLDEIGVDEINAAENYWLQRIQEELFPDEVIKLQQNQLVKRNSKLVHLSPYYDQEDGLIRMGGRIQYADIEEAEKHPIILPYKSYLVKLIVEEEHRRQLHAGINHTLIAVRDKYWIIKGRSLVRRIVKSCLVCRKYSPIRLRVQMSPLPKDRITRSNPFEVCGVDFTGPLYVSNGKFVEKSYIVLFTCATTRAIHLELVQNQSTEAFLRAFRRMISRRGMITTFYSDNSKTFECASKEMQKYWEIMNGKTFKNFLTDHKIEWKFIVDYAAWWGGFYERMMRSIKTPLKKILGRSVYGPDEMYTILTEVEAMVNSRPLTQVTDEPSEMNYLTPACFLIGRKLINIPVKPVSSKKKTPEQKELNRLMVQQNRTLNQIWKTWRENYMRNLGTVPTRVNEDQCIKVGELVMVSEHSIVRTKWVVGVVDKTKEGKDGRVRTVWVRTADGTYSRPVQHISRLEVDSMEDFNLLSI